MTKKVVNLLELKGNIISRNSEYKVTSSIAADSNGRIYRLSRENWERAHETATRTGYTTVWIDGHSFATHDVVYACFNGPLRKGCVIHHIDGDKANNTPNNLQMVSAGTNVSYFFRNETGENDVYVGQTKYKYALTNLIGPEFFVEVPQYSLKISNKGRVISLATGRQQKAVANVKFPTNLIVGYFKKDGSHSTISLSKLFAEAFMVLPPEGKYKVLIKNRTDTLFSPLNYYIFSSKNN